MTAAEPIPIAYLNLYPEMGGGEYAVYNLVKGLDRGRFRPIALFNREGQFPSMTRELGVETVILDYPTVMLKDLIRPAVFVSVLRGARVVSRFLEQSRTRIVHTVDVLGLILVRPGVRRGRIPVLYNVIFFYEFARVALFNLLALHLVSRIVTNSRAIREDLLARTRFLGRKVTTIYYGIDTDRFSPTRAAVRVGPPAEAAGNDAPSRGRTAAAEDARVVVRSERRVLRDELSLSRETKLVGMIARVDTWKGHHTFLRAAAILVKEDPSLHFVVVGGLHNVEVIRPLRAYFDGVLAAWRSLGLEKRVSFLPHRNDIPEVLRSLDLFVCPSEREPIPLIVFEAMASGVPIVAADSGGIPEQIDDGRDGYLFRTGDAAHLAETIRKGLSPDAAPLAAAARRKVEEKFRVDRFVREMEGEYEALLGRLEGTPA